MPHTMLCTSSACSSLWEYIAVLICPCPACPCMPLHALHLQTSCRFISCNNCTARAQCCATSQAPIAAPNTSSDNLSRLHRHVYIITDIKDADLTQILEHWNTRKKSILASSHIRLTSTFRTGMRAFPLGRLGRLPVLDATPLHHHKHLRILKETKRNKTFWIFLAIRLFRHKWGRILRKA